MKLTPQKIVESNESYTIPIYQRLFEWDTDNIQTLLSDLKHTYDVSDGNDDYYIGMLTSTESNELVDGQQRFVVMMLIGCVLKDHDGWKNFIGSTEQPRLYFTSRPHDNEYLMALIAGNSTEVGKREHVMMRKGVETIKEFFEKEFKKGKEIDDADNANRKRFANYIYEHLSFFISTLPNNYSPKDLNTYFERMNTMGKNLEQHEILKVKLLSCLIDKGDISKYMQLWNKLADVDTLLVRRRTDEKDDTLRERMKRAIEVNVDTVIKENLINGMKETHDEENNDSILNIKESIKQPSIAAIYGRGSRCPLTFTYLLLQTLYWYLHKENSNDKQGKLDVVIDKDKFFNPSNLLETFSKYLPYEDKSVSSESQDKILRFIEDLLTCRLILDICFIRPIEEGYSLNMFLEDDDKKKKLMMYESMLYVSSSNATNYKWFGWVMEFVRPGHIPTAEELYNHLKERDEGEHTIPESDLLSYGRVERYWFWKLDYYLWEKRKELFTKEETRAVADNYVFRRNRSIEHIAPQTPQQDATIRLDAEDRDSFGNLAMISSGLNSALSNSSYEEKRAHVEAYCHKSKSGSIESLKLLWIYDTYDKWDKENIGKHMKEAISILKGENLEGKRDGNTE